MKIQLSKITRKYELGLFEQNLVGMFDTFLFPLRNFKSRNICIPFAETRSSLIKRESFNRRQLSHDSDIRDEDTIRYLSDRHAAGHTIVLGMSINVASSTRFSR